MGTKKKRKSPQRLTVEMNNTEREMLKQLARIEDRSESATVRKLIKDQFSVAKEKGQAEELTLV